MKRIAVFCAVSLTIAVLYCSAAVGMIHWTPQVIHDLHALPGHAFAETVVTKTPQAIDVTVALVPSADALAINRWRPGWTGETLDPNAKVVLHVVSAPPASGSPLEHQITLPALPAGLYQVRLASPERTAMQDLNVGTIAAMMNRGTSGSVLMAVDVRTLRARTDVVVLEYTESGARRFAPSKDGIVRLPSPWPAQGGLCSKDEGIVVSASDGSIVPFSTSPCVQVGLGTYVETDRHTYRPGDRVYYRVFSQDASTSAFTLVGGSGFLAPKVVRTANHIAYGSTTIPMTAVPDYWRDGSAGLSVSDSARSRYQIEAATLTPLVDIGDTARFVISATFLNGASASGLRVHYAWHLANTPQGHSLQDRAYGINGDSKGDLAYGDATLDAQGNATVTLPVVHDNTEVYVYDPDTHELVASARAVIPPNRATLSITAPLGEMGPSCIPLAVRETTALGSPAPDRRIHLEVQPGPHFVNRPSPPPVLARDLVTNADGFAIARWCVRERKDFYSIVARDYVSGLVAPDADVAVKAIPNWGYGLVLLSADTPQVPAGATAALTATSASDGDGLVFYGSNYDFHSQAAHVANGVAHVRLQPPPELDDFQVGFSQAMPTGQSRGYDRIAVATKRHLLHLEIGCVWGKKYFCVRVLNWRDAGTAAHLFIDVTAATRAAIVNATARSDSAYEALYSPGRPDYDFTSSLTGGFGTYGTFVAPGKSYLYSLPSPAFRAPTNQSPAATPQPTATPIILKAFEPQTALWLNAVPTDRAGNANITLPRNLATGRWYLIHVIALGSHGEIGEAYDGLFPP